MTCYVIVTQWAHHGQTTLKQRSIDVTGVDTTLFQRRLTITSPLGKLLIKHIPLEALDIFSFKCMPKSTFVSRFKPRCFGEEVEATGELLTKTTGFAGGFFL